jgi:endonuclease YncB( thermonuclease family)
MKRRSIFLIIFLALLFTTPTGHSSAAGKGLVTGVMDGDTIELSTGQRVRYLGLDCPERGGGNHPAEFLAEEAYHFNRDLVYGKEVLLEAGLEARDRYGRILAYVFLSDGRFVNRELVKNGLAHVLYFDSRMPHFAELLQDQREALRVGRGIWAKALQETDSGYRGHKETRRFHRLDCPFGKKISFRNVIHFSSKKEAYWQGQSPCRSCRP